MASKMFKQRYDDSQLLVDTGYDVQGYHEIPTSPVILSPGASTQKLIKDGKIRECFVTLIKKDLVKEYLNDGVLEHLSTKSYEDQTVPVLSKHGEEIKYDHNANFRCESSTRYHGHGHQTAEPHRFKNFARKRSPSKKHQNRVKKKKHKKHKHHHDHRASKNEEKRNSLEPERLHVNSDSSLAKSVNQNHITNDSQKYEETLLTISSESIPLSKESQEDLPLTPPSAHAHDNIFTTFNRTFQVNNDGAYHDLSKSVQHTCGKHSKQKHKKLKRKHSEEANSTQAITQSNSKSNKHLTDSPGARITDNDSYCPSRAVQLAAKELTKSTSSTIEQIESDNDDVVILEELNAEREQFKYQSSALCKRHKIAYGFIDEHTDIRSERKNTDDLYCITPPLSSPSPETNVNFHIFHQNNKISDDDSVDRDSDDMPELELCHEPRIVPEEHEDNEEATTSEQGQALIDSSSLSIPNNIKNKADVVQTSHVDVLSDGLSRIDESTENAVPNNIKINSDTQTSHVDVLSEGRSEIDGNTENTIVAPQQIEELPNGLCRTDEHTENATGTTPQVDVAPNALSGIGEDTETAVAALMGMANHFENMSNDRTFQSTDKPQTPLDIYQQNSSEASRNHTVNPLQVLTRAVECAIQEEQSSLDKDVSRTVLDLPDIKQREQETSGLGSDVSEYSDGEFSDTDQSRKSFSDGDASDGEPEPFNADKSRLSYSDISDEELFDDDTGSMTLKEFSDTEKRCSNVSEGSPTSDIVKTKSLDISGKEHSSLDKSGAKSIDMSSEGHSDTDMKSTICSNASDKDCPNMDENKLAYGDVSNENHNNSETITTNSTDVSDGDSSMDKDNARLTDEHDAILNMDISQAKDTDMLGEQLSNEDDDRSKFEECHNTYINITNSDKENSTDTEMTSCSNKSDEGILNTNIHQTKSLNESEQRCSNLDTSKVKDLNEEYTETDTSKAYFSDEFDGGYSNSDESKTRYKVVDDVTDPKYSDFSNEEVPNEDEDSVKTDIEESPSRDTKSNDGGESYIKDTGESKAEECPSDDRSKTGNNFVLDDECLKSIYDFEEGDSEDTSKTNDIDIKEHSDTDISKEQIEDDSDGDRPKSVDESVEERSKGDTDLTKETDISVKEHSDMDISKEQVEDVSDGYHPKTIEKSDEECSERADRNTSRPDSVKSNEKRPNFVKLDNECTDRIQSPKIDEVIVQQSKAAEEEIDEIRNDKHSHEESEFERCPDTSVPVKEDGVIEKLDLNSENQMFEQDNLDQNMFSTRSSKNIKDDEHQSQNEIRMELANNYSHKRSIDEVEINTQSYETSKKQRVVQEQDGFNTVSKTALSEETVQREAKVPANETCSIVDPMNQTTIPLHQPIVPESESKTSGLDSPEVSPEEYNINNENESNPSVQNVHNTNEDVGKTSNQIEANRTNVQISPNQECTLKASGQQVDEQTLNSSFTADMPCPTSVSPKGSNSTKLVIWCRSYENESNETEKETEESKFQDNKMWRFSDSSNIQETENMDRISPDDQTSSAQYAKYKQQLEDISHKTAEQVDSPFENDLPSELNAVELNEDFEQGSQKLPVENDKKADDLPLTLNNQLDSVGKDNVEQHKLSNNDEGFSNIERDYVSSDNINNLSDHLENKHEEGVKKSMTNNSERNSVEPEREQILYWAAHPDSPTNISQVEISQEISELANNFTDRNIVVYEEIEVQSKAMAKTRLNDIISTLGRKISFDTSGPTEDQCNLDSAHTEAESNLDSAHANEQNDSENINEPNEASKELNECGNLKSQGETEVTQNQDMESNLREMSTTNSPSFPLESVESNTTASQSPVSSENTPNKILNVADIVDNESDDVISQNPMKVSDVETQEDCNHDENIPEDVLNINLDNTQALPSSTATVTEPDKPSTDNVSVVSTPTAQESVENTNENEEENSVEAGLDTEYNASHENALNVTGSAILEAEGYEINVKSTSDNVDPTTVQSSRSQAAEVLTANSEVEIPVLHNKIVGPVNDRSSSMESVSNEPMLPQKDAVIETMSSSTSKESIVTSASVVNHEYIIAQSKPPESNVHATQSDVSHQDEATKFLTPEQVAYIHLRKVWNRDERDMSRTDEIRGLLTTDRQQPLTPREFEMFRGPPPPYPKQIATSSAVPGVPPNTSDNTHVPVVSPIAKNSNIVRSEVHKLANGKEVYIGFDENGRGFPIIPPGMIDLQSTTSGRDLHRVPPKSPYSSARLGISGTLPIAPVRPNENRGQSVDSQTNDDNTIQFPPLPPATTPMRKEGAISQVLELSKLYLRTLETKHGRDAVLSDIERLERMSRASKQHYSVDMSTKNTESNPIIEQTIIANTESLRQNVRGYPASSRDTERLNKIARAEIRRLQQLQKHQEQEQQALLHQRGAIMGPEVQKRVALNYLQQMYNIEREQMIRRGHVSEPIRKISEADKHHLPQVHRMEHNEKYFLFPPNKQLDADVAKSLHQIQESQGGNSPGLHHKNTNLGKESTGRNSIKLIPPTKNPQEQEMLLKQLREQHQQYYVDAQIGKPSTHHVPQENIAVKEYERQRNLAEHSFDQSRYQSQLNSLPTTLATNQKQHPPVYNRVPFEHAMSQQLQQRSQGTNVMPQLLQNAHELHLLRQQQINQQRLIMQQNSSVVRDQLKLIRQKSLHDPTPVSSGPHALDMQRLATNMNLPHRIDTKSIAEHSPLGRYIPAQPVLDQITQPKPLLHALPPMKLENACYASREIEKIVQQHIVKTSDAVLIPAENLIRDRTSTAQNIPISHPITYTKGNPIFSSHSVIQPPPHTPSHSTSFVQRIPKHRSSTEELRNVHEIDLNKRPPQYHRQHLMKPKHNQVNASRPSDEPKESIDKLSVNTPSAEYFTEFSPDMNSVNTPDGNVPVITLEKLKSFITDNPQVKTMFGRPSSQSFSSNDVVKNKEGSTDIRQQEVSRSFNPMISSSNPQTMSSTYRGPENGSNQPSHHTTTVPSMHRGPGSTDRLEGHNRLLRESNKDYFYLILDQCQLQELGKQNPMRIPRPDIPTNSQILIPIYADRFPSGATHTNSSSQTSNQKEMKRPQDGINFADFVQMISTESDDARIESVDKHVSSNPVSDRLHNGHTQIALSNEVISTQAPDKTILQPAPLTISSQAPNATRLPSLSIANTERSPLRGFDGEKLKPIHSRNKEWTVVPTNQSEISDGSNITSGALKLKFHQVSVPVKRKRGRPKGSTKKMNDRGEYHTEERLQEHICPFCDFKNTSLRVVRTHVKEDHFAKFQSPPSKSKWNRNKQLGPKEVYESQQEALTVLTSGIPRDERIQRQLSDSPASSSIAQNRMIQSHRPEFHRQLSDNSEFIHAGKFQSIPNQDYRPAFQSIPNAPVENRNSEMSITTNMLPTGQETTAEQSQNLNSDNETLINLSKSTESSKNISSPNTDSHSENVLVPVMSESSKDMLSPNTDIHSENCVVPVMSKSNHTVNANICQEPSTEQMNNQIDEHINVVTEREPKTHIETGMCPQTITADDEVHDSSGSENNQSSESKTAHVVDSEVSKSVEPDKVVDFNRGNSDLKLSVTNQGSLKVISSPERTETSIKEKLRDAISETLPDDTAESVKQELDETNDHEHVEAAQDITNVQITVKQEACNEALDNLTQNESQYENNATPYSGKEDNSTDKIPQHVEENNLCVNEIQTNENRQCIDNNEAESSRSLSLNPTKSSTNIAETLDTVTPIVSTKVTVKVTDVLTQIPSDSFYYKVDTFDPETPPGSPATNVVVNVKSMFPKDLEQKYPDSKEISAPSDIQSTEIMDTTSSETESRNEDLNQRMVMENGDKQQDLNEKINVKNQCSKCQQIFTTPGRLFAHFKLVHSNTKGLHLCYTCGYTTRVSSILQRHIMKWHTKGLKHTCTSKSCGKTFDTAEELKQHMREHFGNKRKFECRLCGQSYFHVTGLRAHQARHTYDYPFKCGQCGLKFKTKGMLERHEFQRKHFSSTK